MLDIETLRIPSQTEKAGFLIFPTVKIFWKEIWISLVAFSPVLISDISMSLGPPKDSFKNSLEARLNLLVLIGLHPLRLGLATLSKPILRIHNLYIIVWRFGIILPSQIAWSRHTRKLVGEMQGEAPIPLTPNLSLSAHTPPNLHTLLLENIKSQMNSQAVINLP